MTELQLPPAVYLRLDLSPAKITGASIANGVLEKRRVIVTDAYVVVYVDTPEGPKISNVWELVSFEGRATTGWTATVDDGDVINISRSTGCLCGSKLRGVRAYPGVPFNAMY